jgi:hypoxanthine phosphoribosyltransferase
MSINAIEAKAVYEKADRLYSLDEVTTAMKRIAGEITDLLQDADPIVLCVMNGGLIPTGDLLTSFDFPLRVDYIHATRYREQTTGSDLHWIKQPSEKLTGKHVLVVDDILDEGITLSAIVDFCRGEGAAKVYSAVAVEKLHNRSNGYKADFTALTAEDRYLFGYGMDYKGYLRNAPGIFAVNDD